jgi:hypothetical protein
MTTVELPYDLHEDQITVSEAATLAGVPGSAVGRSTRLPNLGVELRR